jgi:hypothetical protein
MNENVTHDNFTPSLITLRLSRKPLQSEKLDNGQWEIPAFEKQIWLEQKSFANFQNKYLPVA